MKLSDHVYYIDRTVSHVYVVISDHIVQIDAGIKNDFVKINNFYKSMNIKPEYILLTSGTYDHAGSLKAIYDEYSPEIYINKNDMDLVTKPRERKGFVSYIESKGISIDTVKNVFSYEKFNLNDFLVIDTPGYTSGSVSIFYKPEKALFTGDAATYGFRKLKVDMMFVNDQKDAELSLKKIEMMDFNSIYPAHGRIKR
ncbi:MBL fold metallo-hydrolase [Picrophilus oshimae]|uniref:Beta-lactamase, type II n=1 Tax=Picrophilus torridus (strain ATCC 700027 / DSM 9790 / JCM 10055 / NBRC 100828 / KAW 2/3) TaxID=1122961 RepID=Q6KZR4_PICTO|nr:MBL fold metallo-hydrolase [Picrophilus oshimae]AAT43788.1 beta-lactamase, type II [Picrophilus oshimae DSM 9789]SMD31145.1 Glyoxylase, beta-lactamase superfamily II [Picrophilus oshimae DSM 9789]